MATAAPITTYSDREFHFRLQTLVIDGGTEVLRNIFDQRLQNRPLNVVLAREQSKINRLRRQKTLTRVQYDTLYPGSGQLPTTSDFDITVIVCLLRNLPCLGCNQNYNWNVSPQTGDTSVEADICRLRGFRNEIAHISSTTGFSKSSFEAKWREIETVLLRLDQNSPTPNFSQTIDSYKYSPMDPANEQKIRTMIKQWQERDRGLDTDMQLIKKDFSYTKEDIENIKKDFIDTKENVSSIKKDFSDTKEDVHSIKKDISDTKEDVKRIKKDVSYLMQDKKELPDDRGRHRKPGLTRRISTFLGFGKKDLLKGLKNDLIAFYKRKHKIIPLSPFIKEDQSLSKFYVTPALQSIEVARSRDGDKEEKTPVIKLRDVFYKENKLCSNIYLAADAGFGKTAFSKRLTLAWCQSQKPDNSEESHFSKDEITAMCEFSFVFLVLLRESSTECDIDMLIWNQIFSQLSHDYRLENLRNILQDETCLVVLDGLDEWTHPLEPCKLGRSSIPHQRVRENISVLTTARPWKLSESGLHSSQIDQKLELVGLSEDSAKKLKRSVISYLHGEQDEKKIKIYESEFNVSVQEKHKSDLTAIPLFLMYFLFLWYYKFNVGRSLADLCSSITELLLSRTFEKDGIERPKADNVQCNTPPCFDGNKLCKQFYKLLKSLGELAFQTLFSEKKENTIVFEGCVAERYLNKDDLTFCLHTGIITQTKVQGASLVGEKIKVSFAHKILQEFLAALYICSAPGQRSVQEIVQLKYKCVKDILDMSKVLMFIVGINAESSFARGLMKIVNEDEITQEYRLSLLDTDLFSKHPLYDLHGMYISCCKEIPPEHEVNLYLQDVFIDWNCEENEYCKNLKRIATTNKTNIKSLYINMYDMLRSPYKTAEKVIAYFELSFLENIEKIYFKFRYIDDEVLPLLKGSVKCLSFSCGSQGSLSCRVFHKVTQLQKLEAIKFSEFNMSHTELRLLLDFISQRDCMKKIKLERLDCTDHWSSCTGQNLDLSRHLSLSELTLRRVRLSKVVVNMASLEKCYLRDLSNQDLALECLNCSHSILNTFVCENLQSSIAIDAVLQTLRFLRYIRKIKLESINFGRADHRIFSPDFENIERLWLVWVTMEASTLREIVDSVLKLQQPVTVDIKGCSISPRKKFLLLKETIRSSNQFKILNEKEDRGSETFVFETIKD